jgi:putative Flp pilus-assembly TadE/G-like protein
MRTFARFWSGDESQRGQAIVLIAAVLLGMLMSVGLAIDAGELFVARRTAQEAADAGAYAGAVILYQGGDNATAKAQATLDITTNGYTDGGGGGTEHVTVNSPPLLAGAPYLNNNEYVEVQISVDVKTSLVPKSGLTTVTVHSIAGAVPLNNSFALMALNRGNTTKALDVEAAGKVKITGAGILVNSTSTTGAYDACNSTCPNVTSTGPIDVTGNYTGTGFSPTPTTGYTQQADPFAGYPKPSTNGLGPPITSLPTPVSGAVTLNPGIYAVPITYAGNTTVTLNTGIYIVEAGMNSAGNLDFLSSAGGVFIFNTLNSYPDSGGTCGSVTITGNATTNLAPMTSGTYKGLLFYQDPACTQPFTISGNGSLTATGTIYVPTGTVVMNGNNATLDGSQVVANTIDVQGGNVTINFTTGATAQPVLPRLAQ